MEKCILCVLVDLAATKSNFTQELESGVLKASDEMERRNSFVKQGIVANDAKEIKESTKCSAGSGSTAWLTRSSVSWVSTRKRFTSEGVHRSLPHH